MQGCLDTVMAVIPKGWELRDCVEKKDGHPCGCITAGKISARSTKTPICKVHGEHADQGARENLRKLREKGFAGPVFTQIPVYELGDKHQSRDDVGRFTGRPLRADMLLCGMSSSNVALIEVQGSQHSRGIIMKRDQRKQQAMGKLGCKVKCFEVNVAKSVASDDVGSGQGVVGQNAGEQSACVGSKRKRKQPSWLNDSFTDQDSIIAEIVQWVQ